MEVFLFIVLSCFSLLVIGATAIALITGYAELRKQLRRASPEHLAAMTEADAKGAERFAATYGGGRR